MYGIFISYRRDDTQGWAGHIFAELNKKFGDACIFMDIKGGIPRGADFEQTLADALSDCAVLLALMGPRWLDCKGSDGRRRLDIAQDWVRKEIAEALKRGIPVFPVLFGGARLPHADEVPKNLRALCTKQAAGITEERWGDDVEKLVEELIKVHPPLKQLNDVATAKTGIRLLRDLITTNRDVADIVIRSKVAIANTYCEVYKLRLFKEMHDRLHEIEQYCLEPMKAAAVSRLGPFKRQFDQQVRLIRETPEVSEMPATLRGDLLDGLKLTEDVFDEAVKVPSDAAYRLVLSELNVLLSGIPPQLDSAISEAARDLELERLLDLLKSVKKTLSDAPEQDPELRPFFQGINALKSLQDGLAMGVSEHGQLQRLDTKLRTVCVGGTVTGALAMEWKRIKLVRSKLKPPFSPPLLGRNDELVQIENDIEAVLARGEEQAALELLREYFSTVSNVFREVDKNLLKLCLSLSDFSQPLKTILDMC